LVAGNAAECVAPKTQSDLKKLLACTNALCCPRDLDLQVNLVKVVAGKLTSLGYSVVEPDSPTESSPEFTGMYQPAIESTFRRAIRQYKKDRNIAEPGDKITYGLVNALTGVNLFERWNVR